MDVHGEGRVNKDQRLKQWNTILLEGGDPGIFSVTYHHNFKSTEQGKGLNIQLTMNLRGYMYKSNYMSARSALLRVRFPELGFQVAS